MAGNEKDVEKEFSLLTPELEALAAAEEAADAAAKARIEAMQPGDVLGEVTSVNISAKKGQRKTPIASGVMEVRADYGCADDAHASDAWHRQISLLAEESIKKAQNRGLTVKEGDFAENITTRGFMPFFIPIGTVLQIGDVRVEISQVGKVCHTRCAIYSGPDSWTAVPDPIGNPGRLESLCVRLPPLYHAASLNPPSCEPIPKWYQLAGVA